MYPSIKIGTFELPTFGLAMVVAFASGLFFAQKRAPKFGLTKDNVADASFWALILGILGARIVFILQDLPYYLKNTDQLLTFRFAGLTSFGGIVFGFIGILIWSKLAKKSPLLILDTFAAPFLLAHSIGRIGCLLNGCCYGGHCDLPWGIHVAEKTGLFHPAQVYDSLMGIAALGILLFMEKRGLKIGQSIAICFLLYGVTRFIYEFWRAGTTSTYLPGIPITDAQAMALVFVIAGVGMYLVYGKKGQEYEAVPA